MRRNDLSLGHLSVPPSSASDGTAAGWLIDEGRAGRPVKPIFIGFTDEIVLVSPLGDGSRRDAVFLGSLSLSGADKGGAVSSVGNNVSKESIKRR